MSVRFSTQQKEKENSLLQLESKNKGRQIKLITILALLIIIFISVITFVIYKNRNKILILNKQLSELNKTKDKLFGIISHDLRSPLSSTQMLSYLLSHKNLSNEEVKKYAAELGIIASSTSNLLDNTLNWAHSQLNGISINKSWIELAPVLGECMELMKPQLMHKNISIRLTMADEVKILADEEVLKFVIRNLLGNAIKYTPTEGEIEIYFDGELMKFSDTGVGIPIQVLTVINDSKINQTIESTIGTAQEKGTGLGVMLVKTYLNAHGGKITAENNLNQGATFCVKFNSEK